MSQEFTLDIFSSPPKKTCFLAGTLVQTENGKIAIELIEKGTKVLAYNTKNEQTEYKTVLETFTNFTEKYVILTTEQDEVIKVTGAHLFYELTSKNWVAASNLSVGMQLMDDQKNSISIRSISVQKEPQPTYNLEVDDFHTYFVGTNQLILTHNANKKLKFTSDILYDFNFYEYYDIYNKPTYVGQTTQGLIKRADQHEYEFKKDSIKKEFIGVSETLPKEIRINGAKGPHKMTPFEAAVTELYEINLRGGKRINGNGLFNKRNPISKSTFDRIKRDFPDFNPCRFYY